MLDTTECYVKDRLAIAITSMVKVDGKIYLGLTSGPNVLAEYDIDTSEISVKKNVFPWIDERGYCTKVHNAMGVLSDGSLLLGEGNHFTWDGIPVTVNYFNRELPESMLARKQAQGYPDVKYTDFCLPDLKHWNRTKSDPGGSIVKYSPKTDALEVVAKLPRYLYVQSMIVDAKRNRAFGHTIPENHFFLLVIRSGSLTDFGRISDYAHHNMVVAPNGICYGGWLDKADGALKLLKFDPEQERLEHLNTIIMPDVGPKIAGNQGIDEWIVARNGNVYVGMVHNSTFFQFHYQEERFERLGQLSEGGRVTSMDEDEHGHIWIGAGYPNMSLIRFIPDAEKEERFTDFGVVNNRYPRCYFHASCYDNGRLYLGETDGFSPSLHVVDLSALKGT